MIQEFFVENSLRRCLYKSLLENIIFRKGVDKGKFIIEFGFSQDIIIKVEVIFSVIYIEGRYWWMMGYLLNIEKL